MGWTEEFLVDAYVFGYPLVYNVSSMQAIAAHGLGSMGPAGINRFAHADQLGLALGRGQELRRGVRRDHRHGIRVEGQHGVRSLDHAPVPEVDAVERPDGHAPRPGLDLAERDDLHPAEP